MRKAILLFVLLPLFVMGCSQKPTLSLRDGEILFLPNYYIGMELKKDDPSLFKYYESANRFTLPEEIITFIGVPYNHHRWNDKTHMDSLNLRATLPSSSAKDELINALISAYGKPSRTGVYWDYEWYDGYISLWVHFPEENIVDITYFKSDNWHEEEQAIER